MLFYLQNSVREKILSNQNLMFIYSVWYQNLCEHTFLNIKYTHHSCSFLTKCTPLLTLNRVRFSGKKEYITLTKTVLLKYILNRS